MLALMARWLQIHSMPHHHYIILFNDIKKGSVGAMIGHFPEYLRYFPLFPEETGKMKTLE